MNKKKFKKAVRLLARPDDFQENKKKLKDVEPWLYEAFLKCLKWGGYIIPSIHAVNKIDKLSETTSLSPEECMTLAPQFRWVNALIDMKPEPESTFALTYKEYLDDLANETLNDELYNKWIEGKISFDSFIEQNKMKPDKPNGKKSFHKVKNPFYILQRVDAVFDEPEKS